MVEGEAAGQQFTGSHTAALDEEFGFGAQEVSRQDTAEEAAAASQNDRGLHGSSGKAM